MSRKKEIEFQTRLTREDVAGVIEALIEGLKEGHLKVQKGGDTLELEVPRVVDLEVEADYSSERASFEIEVSWRTNRAENPDLPEEPEAAPAKGKKAAGRKKKDDKAEAAKAAVKESARAAAEAVREGASLVRDMAGHAAESVREKAKHAAAAVRDMAHAAREESRRHGETAPEVPPSTSASKKSAAPKKAAAASRKESAAKKESTAKKTPAGKGGAGGAKKAPATKSAVKKAPARPARKAPQKAAPKEGA